MEFLDTLSYLDIIGLYIVVPIGIAAILYIVFQNEGKRKAAIFAFCAIGSYFPIFNTIDNEAKNVGLAICEITSSETAAEITTYVAAIIISIAMAISWIGCIDTAYQLLFPKKEKQNTRQKATKKKRKKRH